MKGGAGAETRASPSVGTATTGPTGGSTRTESGWGRSRGAGRPATLLATRGEARTRRMERQPTSVGRVKEPHQVGRNVPGRPEPLLVVHQEASCIHPAGPPGTPTHPIARGLASLNPRACPPRPGGFFCDGPEVPRTQWTTWSFLCAPGPMKPDILKDSKSARNNLTKQQLCGESGKVVTSGWSLPILPSKKFNPGKTKVIDSIVFLDTLTLERRSFRGLRAPGVCFRGRREPSREREEEERPL